ncbi:OmpA family protein [Mucilaginibacter aquatilis]|uniref:OmpA family protein n=1 Tax=Mucilaginibacter aquatilis TaxID=1517760 RepID=A0A6I4IRD4_9SPHI|nr:OmpA family protein [Mucilaginibacter aquatilis]MVN92684.1 OmpA family protein [Mucilaginibacter aquatilis]
MKKIISSIFIVLAVAYAASAQYVHKLADEQYALYNYSKAAELYLQAYKKKPTLYTAERLANSYRMMRDYKEAEKWYATVVTLEGSKPQNIFTYAEVLKNNLKYIEAKEQYTRYYTLTPNADLKQLNYWMSSCDSAIKWMKKPVDVDIRNITTLNSQESDWGAVKYNSNIVFTSDRTDKKDQAELRKKRPLIWFDSNVSLDKRVYGWTGNKYLNLYEQPTANASTDAVKPFTFIAGTDYHIGAASYTADGTEMYFTLTRLPKEKVKETAKIATINLGVYSSKLVNGKWSKPEPFTYNKEEEYSVGDPFIMPDGKTLYFVSNMPGGVGGTDIYYCTKDAGVWSQPINVNGINTPANERTPSIDVQGNMYFSTDGDKGMGGLDVFKAIRTAGGFGSKLNLGYPINSAQDDFAYVVYDNASGYLSSNRTGGVGSDDVYSFAYNIPVAYRLEGVAYDKNTRRPLADTYITLTPAKGSPIKVRTGSNGAYAFTVYANAGYQLKGEKNGYLTDSQKPFSTTGISPNEVLKRNLYLDKIELQKPIRLENIYYDLDKWDIRPDAEVELNKLIKIMKDNPTIVIQLSSHTDSRADDDYNMNLSRKRANAAVEYIITVGDIDEDRVIARGYGETRLLNKCSNGVKCSEAEHQLNRRTEFAILKF